MDCLEKVKQASSIPELYNIKDLPGDTILEEMPKYVPSFEERMLELNQPLRLASVHGDYEGYAMKVSKEMYLRSLYQEVGMFAFVSWRWTRPLAKFLEGKRTLEVMAGRGWLTHALRELGCEVIATDDYSWSEQRRWKDPLTDIEKLDAIRSVERYGRDIDYLIMSWPFMDETAYEVLMKLHEVNPDARVIYIGEQESGCTASDSFFEHFISAEDELESDDNSYFHKASALYQRWEGLHDYIMLGHYYEGEDDQHE